MFQMGNMYLLRSPAQSSTRPFVRESVHLSAFAEAARTEKSNGETFADSEQSGL